ncbi:MAG: alanine racemase, partial [Acetanaerobacterium sp.]
MKDYLRRTWAAVNLDRLDHNIREIRARIPARCALMGVVKADAYGHGDLMVSRRLIENGATWLGVSNIDEAVALRKKGVGREIGILIFGDTPAVYAGVLARHGITQAVYGTPYAQALSAAAVAEGVDVDIHIKADTGMGRIGFVCREAPDSPADEIARAASLPGLCTTGIFTHFA